MTCFLTSATVIPDTNILNPANRFIDELRLRLPAGCRALHICSDPDNRQKMDFHAALTKQSFEDAGFSFVDYGVLDGRNEESAEELVLGADLLILAGGHVPTQNRFFRKIGLREMLKDYSGVIIGISAGNMNSAETVYSQPEMDGEAIDPDYCRFFPGLGLTKTMLLPHYQDAKDDVLDGMRLFEDITFPDSYGRTFYAIPDGSYLFIDSDGEELRGEAYMIRDGVMSKISSDGDTVLL